eukprot:4815950-Lingulodinium_polyedra.AAC.1
MAALALETFLPQCQLFVDPEEAGRQGRKRKRADKDAQAFLLAKYAKKPPSTLEDLGDRIGGGGSW